MKHHAMALLVLMACAPAFSQSERSRAAARGALHGLAGALADQAERQIALEREIELAKKLADIEVDKQRRIANERQGAQRQAVKVDPHIQQQLDALDKAYPQWWQIMNSRAYTTWAASQGDLYKRSCERTAIDIERCMLAFFDADFRASGSTQR
jgi:hypothetical protein